jgi:hypothetical protein
VAGGCGGAYRLLLTRRPAGGKICGEVRPAAAAAPPAVLAADVPLSSHAALPPGLRLPRAPACQAGALVGTARARHSHADTPASGRSCPPRRQQASASAPGPSQPTTPPLLPPQVCPGAAAGQGRVPGAQREAGAAGATGALHGGAGAVTRCGGGRGGGGGVCVGGGLSGACGWQAGLDGLKGMKWRPVYSLLLQTGSGEASSQRHAPAVSSCSARGPFPPQVAPSLDQLTSHCIGFCKSFEVESPAAAPAPASGAHSAAGTAAVSTEASPRSDLPEVRRCAVSYPRLCCCRGCTAA